MKTFLTVVVALLAVSLVSAHGFLASPTARTGTTPTVHTPNCGTTTAGPIQMTASAGSNIQASFTILANHGGSVVWRISYDGTEASLSNVGPTTQVTQTGNYNVTIPLPAGKTCNNCILQWLWNPSTETTPYYGCSDIKIGGTDDAQVLCQSGLFTGCSSASSLAISTLAILASILASLFVF